MTEVTLEFIAMTLEEILQEQRAIRTELRELRAVMQSVADLVRDTEHRLATFDRPTAEAKDAMDLIDKAELMSRSGQFESLMQARLDRLIERVAVLERRFS